MNLIVLKFSLMEPFYLLFGFLIRLFYGFFGNYGISIIVLAPRAVERVTGRKVKSMYFA